MNPLVHKEIRLLLPAYGVALLMATSPLWPTVTHQSGNSGIGWFALCLCVVLMALVPLGREFNLRTFSFLMSQPVTRARIWWTKVAVLGVAMATVFGVWLIGSALAGPSDRLWRDLDPWSGWTRGQEALAFGALGIAVIFTGGLWTTLLVRQIMAAFWFTIFIPAALLLLTMREGDGPQKAFVVLGLYSAAGFLFAWWQFWRAQDAGWTGGVISLGKWRPGSRVVGAVDRVHRLRPIRALLWKELRLQEVTLAGMAGLFVLHLLVVVVRKYWHHGDQAQLGWGIIGAVLDGFSMFWLAVPFVAGCASVAEDRRLGTLEPQSCMPIPRRRQFALKLLVVLLLGGILSPLLGLGIEGLGRAFGSPTSFLPVKNFASAWASAAIFFLILFSLVSAVSFYASTLVRNLIQAMVAALVAAFGVGLVVAMSFSGFGLWFSGPYLSMLIIWPALTLTGIWLTYRNFTRFSDGWSFWLRNVGGFALALSVSMTVSASAYNRVWELFSPLEPAHGPARWTTSKTLNFRAFGFPLAAVLPDGRLWCEYDSGQPPMAPLLPEGFTFAKAGQSKYSHQFAEGTNWVGVAATYEATAAVRADGSLWISEPPRQAGAGSSSGGNLKLVRFGEETNWKKIVLVRMSGSGGPAFLLLLKQDGSLWVWDATGWYGLGAFKLRRLGMESDWSEVFPASFRTFLSKTNGQVWELTRPTILQQARQVELEPGIVIERCEGLEGLEWLSLNQSSGFPAGVRLDGTLWTWRRSSVRFRSPPTQIGTDADWVAVAGDNSSLALLKKDGSLWKMDYGPSLPVRWGTHHDWVGIASGYDGIIFLAADGSLWRWRNPYYRSQQLLKPSRRPELVENMFTTEK